MNTIGAENISDEEVVPGQVAVTGHGDAGGKIATMFVLEAMMITPLTVGFMTVGTVAAIGAMTTAEIEEKPTMKQTFGIPMSTIGRTAVTEASTAAGGNTGGGGDIAEHSAAHLRSTAAGEPRV